MAPLPDVLVGYIEEIVDRRLAAWREATVAIAKEPEPEPAPTGWITDRVPEEVDGDRQENVQVPPRDSGRGVCIVHYLAVRRGTPWAPINDDPGPWDPTTLDRNGWIRSRLPTEGDASKDRGKWVLVPQGKERRTFQEYAVIVPGQPWAPWGYSPGHYQP